jgi:hypothetical protein
MGKFYLMSSIALYTMCIAATGCARLDTTHTIEVKPMHITIDVNLKVDKELDDFFGDIDNQDATMEKEKTNEK